MDKLLELLQKKKRSSPAQLAAEVGLPEEEVLQKIGQWEKDGTILGYHAVLHHDYLDPNLVTAVIEVRVTPEREGGFDRIASRIARFEEVGSVYLMSGGYDLLVVVEGHSLREVAAFVATKLSTIDAVQSCATRFRLNTYKENGIFYVEDEVFERLSVAP